MNNGFSMLGSVYSLSDLDGNIFYIGATTISVKKRFGHHISVAKSLAKGKKSRSCTQSALKIIKLDFNVECKILSTKTYDAVSKKEALENLNKDEMDHIKQAKAAGHKLVNVHGLVLSNIKTEVPGQVFTHRNTKLKTA